MVILYQTARALGFASLFQLAPSTINTDWQGRFVNSTLDYILAVDNRDLYFAAIFSEEYAQNVDLENKRGQFIEGLWEHDVAELFLHDDSSSEYQEFNLSPGGSWWTNCFGNYRVPSTPAKLFPRVGIDILTLKDGKRIVGMQIPLSEIRVNISFSKDSTANVTAIFGINPRIYLSANATETEKPDFHHISSFGKINIKRTADY